MKFKKLLLGIGTFATVAAPIATVVSCGTGSSQYSEDDLLKMSNLKSSEAKSKLQDLWLSKVLIQDYGMDAKTISPLQLLQDISKGNKEFQDAFESTLEWTLKEKLFESKDALSSVYQSLKSNAPESIIGDDQGTGALTVIELLNKKVFDRSSIEKAVTDVMSDATWKDVFYNHKIEKLDEDGKVDPINGKDTLTYNPAILGVKDLILKMMVTKKFLSKTSNEYKDKLPAEYAKLASKYRDATVVNGDADNFPLIVSAMNARFAYENSVELEATKSKQFIVADGDNEFDTEADAFTAFGATGSKFEPAFTYSFKRETVVPSLLAKTINAGLELGFKGVVSLPTGKDSLNTNTASAVKLVGSGQRDGFIYSKDSQNQIVKTKIRFTDEDKTKITLNYYTSLMPYMYAPDASKSKERTLGYDPLNFDDIHIDRLMNIAYTKDSTLYSTAVTYFTSDGADPDVEPSVKINVTNDWARDYYVNEGIKYIYEDNQEKA